MKIGKPASVLTAVLTVLLCTAGIAVGAGNEKEDIPSLFCNDEEWYKDSACPLIVRDGVGYVPVELFAVFNDVNTEIRAENNILIYNSVTGRYISVLFRDGSAAVNGEIIPEMGVFRDSGVYYIEAVKAVRAVGLDYEYYRDESGAEVLRVTDGGELNTLEALIESYRTDTEVYEDTPVREAVKADAGFYSPSVHIYCGAGNAGAAFFARAYLDEYSMPYTMLFSGNEMTETVLASFAHGGCAILPRVTDGGADISFLRGVHDKVRGITGTVTHLVLTSGNAEADDEMTRAGFSVITPDVIIDDETDPVEAVNRIYTMLSGGKSVSVYMKDCRSSAVAAGLLCEGLDY